MSRHGAYPAPADAAQAAYRRWATGELRVCSRCGDPQPSSSFRVDRRRGYTSSWCHGCQYRATQDWRRRHRSEILARRRAATSGRKERMSNDAINQALRAASRPGRFEINSPIPAENREFNYQIRERLGKPSGRPEPPPAAEPTDVPDPGGEPVALTTTADWGGGPRGIPPGPARPSINDGIQEAFRRLRSGDGGRSADLAVVMDDMPRGRW